MMDDLNWNIGFQRWYSPLRALGAFSYTYNEILSRGYSFPFTHQQKFGTSCNKTVLNQHYDFLYMRVVW